jgi:uncharacterized protein
VATINILVKPRASAERITIGADGTVGVAVAAPPVDGQANERLVRTLANALGVARRDIEIVRGTSGKRKVVRVGLLSNDEALARLRRAGA